MIFRVVVTTIVLRSVLVTGYLDYTSPTGQTLHPRAQDATQPHHQDLDASQPHQARGNFFSGRSYLTLEKLQQRSPDQLPHPGAFVRDPTVDESVSPYWADPDGRSPVNLPPNTLPSQLAPGPSQCPRELEGPCNASALYRTITGRCNNRIYPEFGSSEQPMPRILPPVYDLALMRRRSSSGGLLPNPRVVSLLLREAPVEKPPAHTVLLMQMGQFIDHDLVLTRKVLDAEIKKKCEDCSSWRNPACAPIPLPLHDPFISATVDQTGKRRCLPVIRTLADWRPDSASHMSLQQRNFNTAFLDLSTVYGSTVCRQEALRTYSAGYLKETYKGLLPLLPAELFIDCRTPQRQCFLGGDDRVNEHLALLVMHALYLREHNRLARKLKTINPHWDDERLYQEARRINIAQYQNMIYTEFLPIFLGKTKMKEYKLNPRSFGYYQDYDNQVNPGILNEFASAAFRVGHTMIPDDLRLVDRHYTRTSSIPLVQTFENPSAIFEPGKFEEVLRGLVGTRVNGVDLRLVDTILNRLFENLGVPHSGKDLLALNIARGRDHGIPPYHLYVAACEKKNITLFRDLKQFMPPVSLDLLRKIYSNVQDVDLSVGALAEESLPDALIGPTFSCIIAYQFYNLKRGDRFWYENADAGFSHQQLQSIRKSTLARVICNNLDDVRAKAPAEVFNILSKKNPLHPCDELRGTQMKLWAEDPRHKPRLCVFKDHYYLPGRVVPWSPCRYCVCQPSGEMLCGVNKSGCNHSITDEHCRQVCHRDQPKSRKHVHVTKDLRKVLFG
ncbi:peroxidase-like [Homarus americanus]|uniref:peroxidase-like n=1 Tax=Homarus americanus TaxID=6706 RepID=UPI001C47F894|nr:peroxidase-like [Homarus americanus]